MTPQRRHELTDDQWQRLAPLRPPRYGSWHTPGAGSDAGERLGFGIRSGGPCRKMPSMTTAWMAA
jgi:hypothetical protein